jgi:hypothetical protein
MGLELVMLPPLPPWLAPRYALTGIKLGLSALLLLVAVVGCSTQTVRLEGFRIQLPVIGTIGPKGWKPYAKELEGEARSIRIDLELAEARHVATKRAYEDAQAEAARMEAERLARVVARQEEITDEVRQDYSRRIADLRARAARLQDQARAGARGASGGLQLPETGDPASGIDDPAACQEIPARDVKTDIACRAIAEEQAIQLDALIQWVSRQLGATE